MLAVASVKVPVDLKLVPKVMTLPSVPRAGYVLRISFTTDGTAGNVITFGTNFKSTGTFTLATASKYYSITFVSDGTSLIELGRTGAAG